MAHLLISAPLLRRPEQTGKIGNMEHLAERGAIGKERWQHYQDVRDHTALSTAVACTWRTAWFVDSILERTYFDHLVQYWLRCLSFKHWVREAAENIGAGKPSS